MHGPAPRLPPLLLLLAVCAVRPEDAAAAAPAAWSHANVTRRVDLTTHLARINVTVDLAPGSAAAAVDGGSPRHYDVVVPHLGAAARLAHFAAFDGRHTPLTWAPSTAAAAAAARADGPPSVLRVHLLQGAALTAPPRRLHLAFVFSHAMAALPKQITQFDRQLVVFTLPSRRFDTPYPTAEQRTVVQLASHHIEDVHALHPVARRGSQLTFGPYTEADDETAAASLPALQLHFENHAPALTFTHATKTLRWGGGGADVRVRTEYHLEHSGARLVGGFSRLDYQQEQQRKAFQASFSSGTSAAIDRVSECLPPDAHSLVFEDAVGNISTARAAAAVSEAAEVAEGGHRHPQHDRWPRRLLLRLRYPLFGGWRSIFSSGYSMPGVIGYTDAGKTRLVADFGVAVQDAVTDTLVVRVALPVGARDVRTTVPFEVDSIQYVDERVGPYGSVWSALGLTTVPTRPVVVITKRNAVWEHCRPFEVTFVDGGAGLGGLVAGVTSAVLLLAMAAGSLLLLSSSPRPR